MAMLLANAGCGRLGFDTGIIGGATSSDDSGTDAAVLCPPTFSSGAPFAPGFPGYFVVQGTTTNVMASGGTAVFGLGGLAGDYANLNGTGTAPFVDTIVSVEIVGVPSMQAGPQSDFFITNALNNTDSEGFLIENGTVYLGAASLPYDAAAHHWLRIRETSGTLYFEARPATGTWSILSQKTSPSWLATGAFVHLAAGQWMTVASPGTAEFANYNAAPCP